MVAQGIIGYNHEGLSSYAWKNQKPPSLDAFFAGASNIIFTFGAPNSSANNALASQRL